MVEQQATGIYNARGTATPVTFEQFLASCQKYSGTTSSLTWVSEDFLIKHQIQDWVELPLRLSSQRNMPGFLNVNINKALQAGLSFRPLSETLAAIIAWNARGENKTEQIGLSPEKEQALLDIWNSSNHISR